MTLVLLMACTLLFAQHKGDHKGPKGPKDPKATAAKHAERMKTDLTLNDEQYARVKTIYEQYEVSQAAVRADSTLAKDAEHTKMKKLKDDRDVSLKAAVTEAQWTKWQALKEEKKDGKKGGPKKDGPKKDGEKKKV